MNKKSALMSVCGLLLAMPLAGASTVGTPTYTAVVARIDLAVQHVDDAEQLPGILTGLQQDFTAWATPTRGETAAPVETARERLNRATAELIANAQVTADLLQSLRVDFINEALHRALRRLNNGAAAAGMTREQYEEMVEMLTQRARALMVQDTTADAVRANLNRQLQNLYSNAQRQALTPTEVEDFGSELLVAQVTSAGNVWRHRNNTGTPTQQDVTRIEYIVVDVSSAAPHAQATNPTAVSQKQGILSSLSSAKTKISAGQRVPETEIAAIEVKVRTYINTLKPASPTGTPVNAGSGNPVPVR